MLLGYAYLAARSLAGFIVLVLERLLRTRLDDRQRGPHDVLAEFQHSDLLLATLVLVADRQEVLARFAKQRDQADRPRRLVATAVPTRRPVFCPYSKSMTWL